MVYFHFWNYVLGIDTLSLTAEDTDKQPEADTVPNSLQDLLPMGLTNESMDIIEMKFSTSPKTFTPLLDKYRPWSFGEYVETEGGNIGALDLDLYRLAMDDDKDEESEKFDFKNFVAQNFDENQNAIDGDKINNNDGSTVILPTDSLFEFGKQSLNKKKQ